MHSIGSYTVDKWFENFALQWISEMGILFTMDKCIIKFESRLIDHIYWRLLVMTSDIKGRRNEILVVVSVVMMFKWFLLCALTPFPLRRIKFEILGVVIGVMMFKWFLLCAPTPFPLRRIKILCICDFIFAAEWMCLLPWLGSMDYENSWFLGKRVLSADTTKTARICGSKPPFFILYLLIYLML